jgi:Ala-tRNA(Pro) deacylase
VNCMERLQVYLRENEVPFQIQHHPIAYSAQEVAAREHVPGEVMAKTVVVFAGGATVMLALPASHRVDLEKAAAALGTKGVRLAHEGELAAYFPDCEVGAMPPFGNLYDVPVWADRSLAEDETIVFRAGTHTDTMSLKFADYERLAGPNVADFAVHS